MVGTKLGAIKATKTNIEKYGDDCFVKLGRKGGSVHCAKGFAKNRALASLVGRKGGLSRGATVYRILSEKPTDRFRRGKRVTRYEYELIKTGEKGEIEAVNWASARIRIYRKNILTNKKRFDTMKNRTMKF